MYVYFVGTTIALKELQPEYKAIIKALEDSGTTVIADDIFKKGIPTDAETKKGEYFKKVKAFIDKSDMVLVEATMPTDNIKYEIEYALKMKKPVYILYSSEKSKVDAYSLDSTKDSKIQVFDYNSNNLFDRVFEIVELAKDHYDEIICIKLDKYLSDRLTKTAVEKGVSKSQLLKNIVRNYLFNRNLPESKRPSITTTDLATRQSDLPMNIDDA